MSYQNLNKIVVKVTNIENWRFIKPYLILSTDIVCTFMYKKEDYNFGLRGPVQITSKGSKAFSFISWFHPSSRFIIFWLSFIIDLVLI